MPDLLLERHPGERFVDPALRFGSKVSGGNSRWIRSPDQDEHGSEGQNRCTGPYHPVHEPIVGACPDRRKLTRIIAPWVIRITVRPPHSRFGATF